MRVPKPVRLVFAAATVIVVLATLAAHALTFPALTGRVVDEAGVLR